MKRAKLSPTPSLTLTLAIASVLGAVQSSLATPIVRTGAAESTPEISPEISQVRAVASLSQVRGDIAELWTHQGQFTSANANPLKDLPRCGCPACSGIRPDRTEI